jgi:ATP-binding cassette subfamily F protein 3
VGANGIGKTTLLRALLGQHRPDAGTIEWGVNTDVSYFEQEEFALHSNKTALGELWDRFPQKTELELRTVLGSLGLVGEDAFKRVGELSGGERAKLKFAILTMSAGNVLLMDEPTNHLDLPAKEALDDALTRYTGTLLVISHDRYLLNKFPHRIAELHADGIRFYKGNYDSYLAQKAAEAARAKDTPENGREKAAERENAARGKKERAQRAARKQEAARLEEEISALEAEIAALEEAVSTPEIARDYLLLGETCATLEEKRGAHAALFAQWEELVGE